jgi:RNase adaptor protein for sRNA GlmZ degradation
MNKDIKKITKKLSQVSELLENNMGATNIDVHDLIEQIETMIESLLDIDDFEMEVEYDDVALNYGMVGDTDIN